MGYSNRAKVSSTNQLLEGVDGPYIRGGEGVTDDLEDLVSFDFTCMNVNHNVFERE